MLRFFFVNGRKYYGKLVTAAHGYARCHSRKTRIASVARAVATGAGYQSEGGGEVMEAGDDGGYGVQAVKTEVHGAERG